jgi:hypothetical protein
MGGSLMITLIELAGWFGYLLILSLSGAAAIAWWSKGD